MTRYRYVMNEALLRELVADIARSEFEDELSLYERFADPIITRAVSDASQRSSTDPAEFGFSAKEVTETAMQVLILLKGTLEFFDFMRTRSDQKPDALEGSWAKHLIDRGIAPEIAARIAARFYKQAVRVMGNES